MDLTGERDNLSPAYPDQCGVQFYAENYVGLM